MFIDEYPLIDAQFRELEAKSRVLKLENEWSAFENNEPFDSNKEPIVI